ncbi:MAG: class IV adenylate cyclase [Anaerolineae bacterium]
MQETEIKLYVPDLRAIEARLRELGATLAHARVYEKNVRYDDASGGLSAARRVLRLRQDDEVRLTYKDDGAAVDGGPWTRFEAEVTVEDFATMEVILGRLGYHAYMVYEKYRTTWAFDGLEVMLDEMPYGNFVEIEGEGSRIMPLVGRLGLNDAPRMTASYGALFDRVKSRLGLSFDDLTFANFAHIDVPLIALE